MQKDYSSIIVSSRARLSRCIEGIPFPSKMSEEDGMKIISKVYNSISSEDDFKLYKMKDISKNDAYIMQEKHLISHDLIENDKVGAALINNAETISVMINEEDHLREQCILPGLNIDAAYKIIDKIDDQICKKLDIAYDENLGYLTSCITNVGTGLRVSVMLFLPALTLLGKMENITANLKKSGLTVRGAYGEVTDSLGYMYQISNERTLGKTEKEYISLINSIAVQICDMEIDARKQLITTRENQVKDAVFRAFGILTNCYMLKIEEFMRLAGEIKMGISLNIIRMKDNHIIDKLFNNCAPYSLCAVSGNTISTSEEEQKFRAMYVSKILKANRVK